MMRIIAQDRNETNEDEMRKEYKNHTCFGPLELIMYIFQIEVHK